MKKESNIQIGSRVRAARNRMNMTREKLAELLGVSTLFVGYIECGQKGMSLDTLRGMCRVLHVSSDYLLFGRNGSVPYCSARDSMEELLDTVDTAYLPLLYEQLQLSLKTIRTLEDPAGEACLPHSGIAPR